MAFFLGEGDGIFLERDMGSTHRAREARGEEFGVTRELRDVRDVPPELSPGEVMLKNLRRGYRGYRVRRSYVFIFFLGTWC